MISLDYSGYLVSFISWLLIVTGPPEHPASTTKTVLSVSKLSKVSAPVTATVRAQRPLAQSNPALRMTKLTRNSRHDSCVPAQDNKAAIQTRDFTRYKRYSKRRSSTARARARRARQRLLRELSAPNPEYSPNHTSPLDGLSDWQLQVALAYYYEHPKLLPDRDSAATLAADEPPLPIRVQFDEDIFTRGFCVRPLSEDDKQGIDPFTVVRPTSQQVEDYVMLDYTSSLPRLPDIDDLLPTPPTVMVGS